jgi:hypothetical protein
VYNNWYNSDTTAVYNEYQRNSVQQCKTVQRCATVYNELKAIITSVQHNATLHATGVTNAATFITGRGICCWLKHCADTFQRKPVWLTVYKHNATAGTAFQPVRLFCETLAAALAVPGTSMCKRTVAQRSTDC